MTTLTKRIREVVRKRIAGIRERAKDEFGRINIDNKKANLIMEDNMAAIEKGNGARSGDEIVPQADEGTINGIETEKPETVPATVPDVPVHRKRGRPRKTPISGAVSGIATTEVPMPEEVVKEERV